MSALRASANSLREYFVRLQLLCALRDAERFATLLSPALYFETGVLRRAARRHGNGICAFASNNSNSTSRGTCKRKFSPRPAV